MISNSIVFEFLGPPGVGKSTISRMLNDKFEKNMDLTLVKLPSNRYKKIFYKFYLFARYLLTHPIIALKTMFIIIKSKQESSKELLKLIFNHIYLLGLYKTLNKRTFYIIDQGIAQSIWSIKLCARRESYNLNKLIEFNSTEVIYLHIDANYVSIIERLEERKGENSRVEKKPNLMKEALKNNFEEIIEYLRRVKGLHVFTVNNSKSLDESVDQIYDFVLDFCIHKR